MDSFVLTLPCLEIGVKSQRLSEAESRITVFLLFHFTDCENFGKASEDLAFRAGDLLHMPQSRPAGAHEDWIIAVNPRTGQQGEVPCNYITYASGYSAAMDAFKDTDRSGATQLLLSEDYLSKFNYVVRPSSDRSVMALSVRNKEKFVQHYKIYFNSNDQSCSLFPKQTFKTIEDLVIYYMENEVAPGYILQAYKPSNTFAPL
ncbi:Tyrosine protein-kinase src-1 [Taenia crassiceps]|uniref:Tyrosine protein-kinase src-1 n=1 Tax=Taenia crassiceps TaxID=6207 RepID=A0ABR4Q3B5_9CEST